MSQIHVSRISKKLTEDYIQHIPSKDDNSKKESTIEARLSKALVAFSLNITTDTEIADGINCITDGFNDNGIDGLYISENDKTVYFIQAKWTSNGDKTPSKGDVMKFLIGVQDLLQNQFQKFNEKFKNKQEEFCVALADPLFKFELIIVHSGLQSINGETLAYINSELNKLNDPYEIFSYKEINQKALYQAILDGNNSKKIDIDTVTLHNWGIHREPYESFYGEIDATIIAQLYNRHGQFLLNKNIRVFKGITQVNIGMRNTLTKNPADFWYFNNGITMLCNGITKTGFNGSDRTSGVFSFKNVSIVNGAQTYGSIGEAWKMAPDDINVAKVQVRIINVEGAPENYSTLVTRYNNTQNRIESRDFASLDPEQNRIKEELQLDNIGYSFRSGDKLVGFEDIFDLEEATIALACASPNIEYSILANRNLGAIWEDITRPPYKLLFNEKTIATEVWAAVKISRTVNEYLNNKMKKGSDETNLAIHGNRFILHKVFKLINHKQKKRPLMLADATTINLSFDEVFLNTFNIITSLFNKEILYVFFKNSKKVMNLSDKLDLQLGISYDLFNLPDNL